LLVLALVLGGGILLHARRPAGPDPARAAFERALAAQQMGRFHEAREGYLRALALDPNLADARYQLALLTHAANAQDESRHDLAELERIAPGDPRISSLRALIEGSPADGGR
jgi:tetratricopeptide (TPR) repeat protein